MSVSSVSSVSSNSFDNVFASDPVLSRMNDPNIEWADILMTSNDEASKSKTKATSLRRKVIQRTWPVLVRAQPSTKLGIQWNVHKLAEWRASNPNPLSWKSYEVQIVREMIHALRNSNWIVSAPAHSAFLCSIERPDRGCTTDVSKMWHYEEPECPTMLCLNDIKHFFPVIWHKVDNTKNCKMYSIELYHDKIHSMAYKRGVIPEILTIHLSHLLTKTLPQSPAWEVQNSNIPGEFCRIMM